ncbi:MAG: hypothetical protein JNK04_03180, partial [Myxococcales bacterium]|nr:hypothetical protein [Myxococcales bacterium]
MSTRKGAWTLLLTACLGLFASSTVACDKLLTKKAAAKEESDSDSDESDRKKKSKSERDDNDDKPSPAKPSGRFVFKDDAPTKAEHKPFEALFKDKRFSGVVDAMGVFALPQDVVVYTADVGPCAQPNAFYMGAKHAVFLCHPLAKASYENFIAMGKSDQEASNLTRDAMTFVMLHELGHALIGELGLGVTGKEEDAVDELATLILIENGKHDMAIAGTYALVLLNQFQGKGHKTPFFDEHSVSEARLYDVFCMILGSNPKKFAEEILRERPELKQRAPKCPATYQKIDKAWTSLLAPHKRSA